MSNFRYLFIQQDYAHLIEKIKQIGKLLEESNRDAIESTQESSETWHDNWRFEEGKRQNTMLSKQIMDLKDILDYAKIIDSPDKETLLGYKIRFVRNGKEKELIVGSYFPFSNDKNVFSYNAPFILSIKNVALNEEYLFGPKKEKVILLEIKPHFEYFNKV